MSAPVHFDLILYNGYCVTPAGCQRLDIGIRGGLIAALGELSHAGTAQRLDLKGLHILPGVIDTQVHFREPGLDHKEDLATGTKAAVLGGVTAIFEMPNTRPATVGEVTLHDKLQRCRGRAWCDYAFFIGGTCDVDTPWEQLERLPGCAGIKLFIGSSTGDLLVDDDAAISRIFRRSRRRTPLHAEDEARMKERFHIAEAGADPRFHPEWRDVEAALIATKRVVRLARAHGHPINLLHVTTRDEMAFIVDHKDLCSVEVTPQHLTLVAPDAYERLGTFAQMNPPIRSREHQQALWQALAQGVVDVIGSDHAPHTREEKAAPYPKSPSGMPGVQTLVPVMLDHVNAGRLSLERFVDLTAAGPARIYNIAHKGRIAVGYHADFTVVDLNRSYVIDDGEMASKCGWTPFHGMRVTGWPTHTLIRGHLVMAEGELLGSPKGEMVRFWNALPLDTRD